MTIESQSRIDLMDRLLSIVVAVDRLDIPINSFVSKISPFFGAPIDCETIAIPFSE